MRRRDENYPDNGFEGWGGYMNAKRAKLEEQFSSRATDEEKTSSIFDGISIFVNGYTTPSADELKKLMAQHGGIYHTYQRSDDFIIASNLPDTKIKNMSLVRVVKPEWITESIEANQLLDYREYLLYKNSRTQSVLQFNKILKTDNVAVNSKINNNARIDISSEFIHNSIKQNEHRSMTKTAANPSFISEFYNNSRLHHISQLGACFKQHINELREQSTLSFPARLHVKDKIKQLGLNLNSSQLYFENSKTIMHIDMDCFFVSVGLRNRPELKGRPIAVTHSKAGQARSKRAGVDRNTEFNLYKQRQAKKLGQAIGIPEDEIVIETRVDNITDEDDKFGSMSEIASCSYEARAKGISNGMFMGSALKLCPELQTIPYDFEGYKEVAFALYNTIAQYTLDIEAVSCDEMYVDCTELLKDLNINAQDFATLLRDEIKTKTGCPCSTGFGGNRLQARLATKKAKPDGQFFLTADLVADFMHNIGLRDLPGVGRQIAQKLETLGHRSCGSLQCVSLQTLQQHLGIKTGSQLYEQCRGRDNNPLSFLTIRKSVSAEVNYGIRFENEQHCIDFIKQLSSEVQTRMEQFKVLGKCITLKLMVRAEDAPVETAKFMGHGFCNVINKSINLNIPTSNSELISREVIALVKKLKTDPKEMRGLGIQMTKLDPIIVKPVKGAMNKFLSNNATLKKENIIKESVSSNNTTQKVHENLNLLSPKKNTSVPSPRKKSPNIGSTKSPRAKRRGRPPKTLGIHLSTSKNLLTKFVQIKNSEKETLNTQEVKKENVKANQNENVFKEMRKPEINQGLLSLSWEKVRELLRAWLDSGQTPLLCDIKLITEYLREMVVNRKIDKLNIILNFLRRRTRELMSKDWINVYDHIIENVQNTMIAIYGKRLYIYDEYK